MYVALFVVSPEIEALYNWKFGILSQQMLDSYLTQLIMMIVVFILFEDRRFLLIFVSDQLLKPCEKKLC